MATSFDLTGRCNVVVTVNTYLYNLSILCTKSATSKGLMLIFIVLAVRIIVHPQIVHMTDDKLDISLLVWVGHFVISN